MKQAHLQFPKKLFRIVIQRDFAPATSNITDALAAEVDRRAEAGMLNKKAAKKPFEPKDKMAFSFSADPPPKAGKAEACGGPGSKARACWRENAAIRADFKGGCLLRKLAPAEKPECLGACGDDVFSASFVASCFFVSLTIVSSNATV